MRLNINIANVDGVIDMGNYDKYLTVTAFPTTTIDMEEIITMVQQ